MKALLAALLMAMGALSCTALMDDIDTSSEDTETADTETADTETVDTETTDTETADTETVDTETADTETADTETVDTETADTETADTETVDTETVDTETADTETADTETEPLGDAVYVSAVGSAINDGLSPDSPVDTLALGIFVAVANARDRVLVAAGDYNIDSSVEMANGVDVLGGYATDFSTRNPAVHVSAITDVRYNPGFDLWAVVFPSSLTVTTVIEGFTIRSGQAYWGESAGNMTCAVEVESSFAVVRGNRLLGALTGYNRCGVYVVNASPLLEGNVVTLREEGASSNRGFTVSGNSSPIIRNNAVTALHANYNAAIMIGWETNESPVPVIQNNTLYSGGSPDSDCYDFGIAIRNRTFPIIENNILVMKNNERNLGWAIEERNDANPTSIRNNAFYNWPHLYSDVATSTYHSNINNAATTTGGAADSVSGNVVDDPLLVDMDNDDLHLQLLSPLDIRGGGRDLSADFLNDLGGFVRTSSTPEGATNPGAAGWSMGAYEID